MQKEFFSATLIREEAEHMTENARRKSKGETMERTDVADSLLHLRTTIEQALSQLSTEQDERALHRLSELFASAPELITEHQEILQLVREQKGFIGNGLEPAVQERIQAWSKNIETFLAQRGATDAQLIEVHASIDVFFQCVTTAVTTRALHREIRSYREENEDDFDRPLARERSIKTLKQQLGQRYPFHPKELSDIVDILFAETEDPLVALKKAVQVISRIWKEYGSDQKGETALHASIGVILQKILGQRLNTINDQLQDDQEFRASVLADYLITHVANIGASAYQEMQFDTMNHEIERSIQRRLLESVFFRTSQFDPDASDEHVIETVQRGQEAISYLMRDLVQDAFPAVASLVMSAATLTRANPFLTPVGLMSIPLLLRVEKEKQRHMTRLADHDEEDGQKKREKLQAYRDGLEQLKTSPGAGRIIDMVMAMDEEQHARRNRPFSERFQKSLWRAAPKLAAYTMIGSIGSLLQSVNLAKGKEVIKTIHEIEKLQRTVAGLLELFDGKVSNALRAIQRMEEALGTTDSIDPPNGPLEQSRKPLRSDQQDIVLQNISYTVEDGAQDVLRDINAVIKQGDYVLIVGKSGSGKTTLLRHISGLLPAKTGEVRIGNEPIQNIKKYGPDSLYAGIAYSNQKPILYKKMTVRENLMIWMPTETRTDEEIRDVLHKLGLQRFATKLDDPLAYASGGETVRIGLARMLLKKASILLLDEPTAGLDDKSAEETRTLLRDLHKNNPRITIICVTHDKDLMEQMRASDDPRARVVTMEEMSGSQPSKG